MKIKNGFTLIELSITIVIIGLVAATFTSAQALIYNSRIQGVVKDINNIRTYQLSFLLKYSQLPGDFDNAGAYFPDCTDKGLNTCNGNGDGRIHNTKERWRLWQHLVLSDQLNGPFS